MLPGRLEHFWLKGLRCAGPPTTPGREVGRKSRMDLG